MKIKVLLNPYSNRWNANKRWAGAESALWEANLFEEHGFGGLGMPIVMTVERLDRSPAVLEAIQLIVREDTIALAPKPHHYSAVSRILVGKQNQLVMDLQ